MGKTVNHKYQMTFDHLFKEKFNNFIESTKKIYEPIAEPGHDLNSDIASCYAVAESMKKAIRESGNSREQIVDAVNRYFNRTAKGAEADPPECLGMLTVNMLNNYLPKPAEYRVPAYMLFAIQAVTQSLEPSRIFVEAMGGEVATSEEAKQLRIVKLQDTQHKAKQLEKELRELMTKN